LCLLGTSSYIKLLLVWAESSSNGLVLPMELFGLVANGIRYLPVWFGLVQQQGLVQFGWGFKYLYTESAHSNIPSGKQCRTCAWSSRAWASGALLGSAAGDGAHLNHGCKWVVSTCSLVLVLVRFLKQASQCGVVPIEEHTNISLVRCWFDS